jgi:hypothetical protein
MAQYMLGNYSIEETNVNDIKIDPTDISSDGELKYVAQQYVSGDACELDAKARDTEVCWDAFVLLYSQLFFKIIGKAMLHNDWAASLSP